MARFDLLDEYSCIVAPKRSPRRPDREQDLRQEGSLPARNEWRRAAATIAGLAVLVIAIATL
jgi:hypothetical protein